MELDFFPRVPGHTTPNAVQIVRGTAPHANSGEGALISDCERKHT